DDPSLADAVAIRSAKARANKARVLLLLGEFEPALELHRQARATFAEHGETASVLRQDHFLAEVFAGQARYTAPARLYVDELAAQEFAASGLTAQLGLVALEQAGLWLREQDWSEALDQAARARSLFVERGLVPRATQATLLQARALLALGELAAAGQLAASA